MNERQEKINATVEEWRREHPEATLTEIEEAVDRQVGALRRQMVEDPSTGSGQTSLRMLLPLESDPDCWV